MGATAVLADWVVTTLPGAVPDDAWQEALRCTVNALGVALLGSTDPVVPQLARTLGATDATRDHATVLGHALRLPAGESAIVNGVAIHLPAYDDIHPPTGAHTSAVVFPAVLGLSGETGASGAEALLALLLGVEVHLRLAAMLGMEHYDQGWHNTATAGVFGATAAAARLLDLSPAQLEVAFGLAGSMASGLREAFSSGVATGLNTGRAAANGILAARLARSGIAGPRATLDQAPGYPFTASPAPHPDALLDGLGARWMIREASPKPYATGVFTHAAVDAGLALHARHTDAAAVQELVLEVDPWVARLCDKPAPETGLKATMSLQHGLAVALLDGAAGPAQFTDARVLADDATRLRGLIRLEPVEGLGREAARVTATLAGGEMATVTIEHQVGSPANPVPDALLDQKFRWTAGARLDPEAVERLRVMAWRADQLGRLDDLVRESVPAG